MSALLALTDNAVEAVRDIVSSSDEASETSGLRMVAEREGMQANFQLSVVPLPADTIRAAKGISRGLRQKLLEERALERRRG